MLTRRQIQQHLLEEQHIKSMYDFHDSCMAKNLFRNISGLVKTAKETYKEDLDIRRNRLRQLIENEEHGYELEYRQEVASRLEITIRQRQDMLLKIRNEKLKEEADFIKAKKAEQIMNNSDKFRTMSNKDNLRDTKRIQLIQIEENKQKRVDAQKLECMWLDVQQRLNKQYDQKQEYENCITKSIAYKTRDYNLEKATVSKEPIDMSSDYYEGFGSLLKNDLKGEQEKMVKRKQIARENVIHNNKMNEVNKSKHCRELEIQNLYNETAKREHELTLKNISEKKARERQEMDTYLEYLRQMKKEIDLEKCEEEHLVMLEQMKVQCKELEKYNHWKKQRYENSKRNHQILVQQIMEHDRKKHDDTIMAYEQHLADIELKRRENSAEIIKVSQRKIKELQLADDLLKQAEDDKLRVCMDRQKDIADFQRVQQYQDNIDELALKFSREIKPSKIHPNMKLLKCPCVNP